MMDRKIIKNGRLILEDKVLEEGTIIIENGIIKDIGKNDEINTALDARIIDAENCLVGPGFIDIHTHLCTGSRFFENPDRVLQELAGHGVTGILPTIAYNLGKKETEETLKKLSGLDTPFYRKMFLGIHLEGPYLNPGYGAESWKMRKPDKKEYERYFAIAGDKIKIWVVAPEVEGTADLIAEISRRKIVLSIGHSEAEAGKTVNLIAKGLKLACHCMCATGITPSPSRYGGTREVGVDEVVMLRDEIYAEVIPDSAGAHVRPMMLQLLYKVKGADRIIIITDVGADFELFSEKTGSDVLFNQQGQLSGTALTMDQAAKNMIQHTGINYFEAFKMTSLNPAKLLEMDQEIGSIKKGRRANLVIVKDDLKVEKVLIDGEVI